MASREDELKKYLEKRERKRKKRPSDEIRLDAPKSNLKSSDKASDVSTWFRLNRGGHRLAMAGFLFLPLAFAAGTFLAPGYGIITFFGLMLLYLVVLFLDFGSYQKFVSGQLYPVEGWTAFIKSRSDDFWKRNAFAYLYINIEQSTSATDLERKAVLAFYRNWVDQWNNRYAGSWPRTNPRDFFLGSSGVEGHAELGKGMPFVLRQLLVKFPELLRMLPKEQVKLVIRVGPDLDASADVRAREDDYQRFETDYQRYQQREREQELRNDD